MNFDSLQSFYSGRKVLVTGHTGFKGSWLCVLLKELGAEVVGLSLEPKPRSLFRVAGLEDLCTHYVEDIRNLECVQSIVSREAPQVVFHLAAQALVGEGRQHPVDTFSTNVQGTVHVLEACRKAESIVIASSDKCYAPSKQALSERAMLGGNDPYSASKAALEHVVSAYRSQYFNQGIVATVRASNVIGGGDWGEARLIPDILRAIQSQSTLLMRHPRACRAWQYVLEALWGYVMLAARLPDNPQHAKAWNIGPKTVSSVSAVVYGLAKAYGTTPSVRFVTGSPAETMMLRIDSSQAEHELAWCNKLDWEQALSWTAEDYRTFEAGDVAAAMALRIKRYSALWDALT